jgi:hypothetical protein
VSPDLDKHYALPIEIATAITKAWRQTLVATSYVDELCSDARRGDARADVIPQMPVMPVRQEPGPPSDPIRDLLCAIGAVAKVLSPKEIREDVEAQKAMDTEYQKLQVGGTWRIKDVKPWREVRERARRAGTTAHKGRVFGISTIKGSELPIGHKDRTYKGRYVFDGRDGVTRDEMGERALFQNRGSSPATLESSKIVDAFGLIEGNDEEVSDAPQAYTQEKLRGTEAWVVLPKQYWPDHFHNIEDPVVPLDYSLYGHPDAGTFWEDKSHSKILSVGFKTTG